MEDIIIERIAIKESVVAGRKWKYWLGWVLSILPSLLLFMSAFFKFTQPAGFEEGLKQMGWDANTMRTLGFVEIGSTIIYLIPRTAVFGAVLLAAYLGGAVATHVRVGDPFIAPVLVGVLIWVGLWLREPGLRTLTPVRSA
jgi:hypothetical protein